MHHSWGNKKKWKKVGEFKVKSSREKWDHWWCQLLCFDLMSLDLLFVRKRKKDASLGEPFHRQLKPTWFWFFHSWIKFLVSMIAVYPQQSQTPTLKPAQWWRQPLAPFPSTFESSDFKQTQTKAEGSVYYYSFLYFFAYLQSWIRTAERRAGALKLLVVYGAT